MATVKSYASATASRAITLGPTSSGKTYAGGIRWGQPSARLKIEGLPTTGGHLSGNADRINSMLEQRHGRQHNVKFRPRGAALAEEVFQAHWYGEDAMDTDPQEEEASAPTNYPEQDYGWQYQPSLELETTIELQERLQNQIRKFEYAYDKMCLAAIRWHQLMEDVHDDAQVRKMFLDMQMIRKLSGMDSE